MQGVKVGALSSVFLYGETTLAASASLIIITFKRGLIKKFRSILLFIVKNACCARAGKNLPLRSSCTEKKSRVESG